jgi:hypothetical protein
MRILRIALLVQFAFLASAATTAAQTVTIDFDAPDYLSGTVLNRVDNINFHSPATLFTPTHVVTYSGTQALRVSDVCQTTDCTNNAYRMDIRFGQPLTPTGSIISPKRADSVSMMMGADSIGLSCFPEGTSCAIYARLSGFDDQGHLIADSGDVFLLDSSSLSTGAYSAPINHPIAITDPQARIVRVTLVYGKGTFNHDGGIPFPGEPQIDHLVVNFPETLPSQGTPPPAPTLQITAPINGSQRSVPYGVHLQGSVTAPGGLATFCYGVNTPEPNESGCHNNTDLHPDDTFDIDIPDNMLGPSNTLFVTVWDLAGQHTTKSVSLTAVAPPPPVITLYSPTNNQWIDPTKINSINGTVRTVGALQGFCVRIDSPTVPTAGTCVQDLSAIKSINTQWQPLSFTKMLSPNQLTIGAHHITVFAVDRWNQFGRADVDTSTPTDFRVVGMEITQGIQTIDIPLNVSGFAPYTGVNLRVGVPTVVRVFANTAFAGSYTGVRMLLNAFAPDQHNVEMPVGSALPDSSPAALSMGPLSVTPSMRADPAGAYVFTLPTSWTQQNGLRLQAQLMPPFGAQECPTCTTNNTFSVTSINFGPAAGIKIASVALTFVDSTGTFNSPGAPSTVFAEAINLMATPASNVIVLPYAGSIDVSDLVGPIGPGGTTAPCREWTSICQARIYSRMRIWEALHPQDADWMGVGPVDVGWTVAPIGIANSNILINAVAHELFHDLGYYHASGACGADDFILWPPDERGFIHGVGLDRRMNQVDSTGKWTGRYRILMDGSAGVTNYYDLMSYCTYNHDDITWISVDNWNVFGGTFPNGLFPYLDAFSGTIGSGSAPLANRETKPVLKGESPLVTALLDPQGQVHFLSIATVPYEKPSASIRLKSDYVFVARNRQGTETARIPATVELNTGHHNEGPEPRIILSARIPTKDVDSLEVEYKGKAVAKRVRSKSAPVVQFLSAEKGMSISRAESVETKWQATDNDGDPLEIRIEFSERKDKPFRPLFIGPNRGALKLGGHLFSATTQGRLRIIANDGFNETTQIMEPIVVSAAPPMLEILSPADATALPSTTPVRLRAAAFGDGDMPLSGEQIHWSLDGAAVGTGLEVEVRNLKPGKHVATVTATENELNTSRDVEFTVFNNVPEDQKRGARTSQ